MSFSPIIAFDRPRDLQALALLFVTAFVLAVAAPARGAELQLDQTKLWATVNACDTAARPDTIGLRASMPGTGNVADEMFMRFRVQYFSPADGAWLNLVNGGDSGFVDVGSGRKTREAGRFFALAPLATRNGFQLRGLVNFEWRRGDVVTQRLRRLTTPKRVSAAGADPPGYSAAICVVS